VTSFAVRSVRLFFYPPAAPCRDCTAGIASDALRPTLSAAAETIEPIIAAATDAIASELHASREEMDGSSVPQYAAAIEAAGSLGQTLKSHFAQSGAGLDGVLTLTAALAHAHEEDMAVYRANVSRDPNRAVSIHPPIIAAIHTTYQRDRAVQEDQKYSQEEEPHPAGDY
jgi:hypothetical protein